MGQVIHAEELSRLREEYSLFKENCQREKEELMVHHKHKHTYIHTYKNHTLNKQFLIIRVATTKNCLSSKKGTPYIWSSKSSSRRP